MNLNREQLLVIVFMIIILLVGSGIFFWQFRQNQQVVTDLKESFNTFNTQDSLTKKSEQKEEPHEPETVIVHVAGAVRIAGVYELEKGARVVDALKLAGGETARANLDIINLAAPIYDGDKIYIPVKGNRDKKGINEKNSKITNSTNKIDLNSASQEELEELSGIGPSKSKSIVKYRERINGFAEIKQLLEVSGIGEKTLAKIKDELILR